MVGKEEPEYFLFYRGIYYPYNYRGCMVWYIYPFGFNNIHFFYKRFYEISKGTGYEINSENFVRQFMLFAANMIGVVSGVKVLSIFFKIYSALLMLVLSIKNYYRRRERNSFFILTLTGIPLLLFFMQSFVVGNFFNLNLVSYNGQSTLSN